MPISEELLAKVELEIENVLKEKRNQGMPYDFLRLEISCLKNYMAGRDPDFKTYLGLLSKKFGAKGGFVSSAHKRRHRRDKAQRTLNLD
jgi:hypothetical protein